MEYHNISRVSALYKKTGTDAMALQYLPPQTKIAARASVPVIEN